MHAAGIMQKVAIVVPIFDGYDRPSIVTDFHHWKSVVSPLAVVEIFISCALKMEIAGDQFFLQDFSLEDLNS